ncbi:uncharacterized protein [Leptinotarsa decemlineata]|uniref:uncharacterized protein n=1 Tax=Leptinotarsa decemlineata TaxID=7539 RepID=UPI003D304464
MTKVCRMCLQKLQRGSKYFNINAVESFTGFMPYRDQLTTCIPEMALDLIPNPVICNTCRTALKSAYDFKSRCLIIERKIQQYIEGQSDTEEINYDLSRIPATDLPPLNRYPFLQNEFEQEERTQISEETKILIQKEVTLPRTGEIEIVHVRGRKRKPFTEETKSLNCTRCGMNFPDVRKLLLHKAVHGDDFVCNFCNMTFKSLQYLRKHNNICSKSSNSTEPTSSILTRRPHLPTKAKNHLKRWLFRHTDHPYPTDHEKQMLMQETNLSLLQVENWFINARRRILQDLTKLKKLKGGDHDDINECAIGLEMELEEIVTSESPPLAGESILDPLEEVNLPAPSNVMIKEDPDVDEESLDISEVKTELVDDR